MDAVLALLDNANDFCEPYFACVIDFERATGDESQVIDREENSVKNGFVGSVERIIDKNVLIAQTNSLPSFSFETHADHRGHGSFDGFGPDIALAGRCLH